MPRDGCGELASSMKRGQPCADLGVDVVHLQRCDLTALQRAYPAT